MSKSLQHQILTRARDLVLNKQNWTDDYYAKTKDGKGVAPWSTRAVRFCAKGAVFRAHYELTGERVSFLEANSIPVPDRMLSLLEYKNQTRGHAGAFDTFYNLLKSN